MVLLLIVQGILIGALCSYVAGQKNRSKENWFFLGLLFSLLALIALAAIPPLSKQKNSTHGAVSKNCPRCKEEIKSEALICRYCGLDFPFIDASVRDHLLLIKPLVVRGLNDDDVASDLNARGVKCLTNDGIWKADLVASIRRDYAINQN